MAQSTDVQSEELRVPEVGESITEVVIGQWHKQEGDSVQRDEEIVELESEKATFEAPAPVAGVLTKILKKSGDSAEVGEVIAHIEPGGGGAQRSQPSSPAETPPPTVEPANQGVQQSSDKRDAATATSARDLEPDHLGHRDKNFEMRDDWVETSPRVMPAAARALGEHAISPEKVQATGPGNRMLKEDVERHLAGEPQQTQQPSSPSPQPSPSEVATSDDREVRKPMSPLRRRIASRLVEAQENAALLTTFNEADLTEVKQLRKEHGDAFQLKKHGVKLGFMAFFVKAVVEALKNCPELNARIDGDDIVYQRYYDIGIAIGTEKGLVVPILRDADRMGFAEIENCHRRLRSSRPRRAILKIDEMMGGTFTIS